MLFDISTNSPPDVSGRLGATPSRCGTTDALSIMQLGLLPREPCGERVSIVGNSRPAANSVRYWPPRPQGPQVAAAHFDDLAQIGQDRQHQWE